MVIFLTYLHHKFVLNVIQKILQDILISTGSRVLYCNSIYNILELRLTRLNCLYSMQYIVPFQLLHLKIVEKP